MNYHKKNIITFQNLKISEWIRMDTLGSLSPTKTTASMKTHPGGDRRAAAAAKNDFRGRQGGGGGAGRYGHRGHNEQQGIFYEEAAAAAGGGGRGRRRRRRTPGRLHLQPSEVNLLFED